jgi:hypothetical protein
METCGKCNLELNVTKGIIKVEYGVYFKGAFHVFFLCRFHFLEADQMNSEEFMEWIQTNDEH